MNEEATNLDDADDDDVPRDIDFSDAVQGKHYRAYWASRGLVQLDEDLRGAFPDSDSVNRALRILLEAGRKAVPAR